MTKNIVLRDFKNNWFVCFVLIAGMLPLWFGGYCMYILILLLPLVLFKVRDFDSLTILVILFSLSYTLIQKLNGHVYSPSSFLFDLFFPFILCQTGYYVVTRFRSRKSIFILVILMICALTLPAISESILDAIKTGQLINVSRLILDDAGDITRSPTLYGMMLAIADGCLGAALIKTYNKRDFKIKILIIVFSILAIFSTIHLLNRTGLVLAAVSLFVSALFPPYSLKKNLYFIFTLLAFICVGFYLLQDNPFLFDAMEYYEARDAGAGSVSSYGGRTERWLAGLQQVIEQPMGNPEGLQIGHYLYAHNMWIDAGVKGGAISLLLLIFIGIIYIKNCLKIIKLPVFTNFERDVLILISIALFLQLNTEPVLEGFPLFFWFFIFYASTIKSLNKIYIK